MRVARTLWLALVPFGSMRAQLQLLTPQVLVDVPNAPTPFRRDGGTNLAYELHVTNMGGSILLVQKAEVLDNRDSVLASFDAAAIPSIMARPVPALKLIDPRMIESGRRAVLFVWLNLPAHAPVPGTLRHRLTFRATGPQNFASNVVTAGETHTGHEWAPTLGPPLRGGPWVARFSGNGDAHRRTIFAVNGRPLLSQRFAIDFAKLGPDWRQFKPGGSTNADMYGYADDILAVADGRIVAAGDSMKENDPLQPQPVPSSVMAAFGNHVVLDLGDGRFALYAHMLPGSVLVRPGDRVKKGQTLGKIGNTGAAAGPHLHFQVMTDQDLGRADGYPYTFESFTLLGIESATQFESREWHPDPSLAPKVVQKEMTPNAAVVRFP